MELTMKKLLKPFFFTILLCSMLFSSVCAEEFYMSIGSSTLQDNTSTINTICMVSYNELGEIKSINYKEFKNSINDGKIITVEIDDQEYITKIELFESYCLEKNISDIINIKTKKIDDELYAIPDEIELKKCDINIIGFINSLKNALEMD